jgi:hypothetical protein
MTLTSDHIVLDPAILAGKPVVRGTRLSVEFVIGLMADGWNEADIIACAYAAFAEAGSLILKGAQAVLPHVKA